MMRSRRKSGSPLERGLDPGKGLAPAALPALPRRSRIQEERRQTILDAALELFSAHGFRGATIDRIAARAGMSKPNLLYYFACKDDLYVAVLERTLQEWLEPLTRLDPAGDPLDEIARYVAAKLALSRDKPDASRLFAAEILHGAPAIGGFLSGPLKALVDDKAALIRGWAEAGRISPVEPRHLLFLIWAMTQHYADFDAQVRAVLGAEGEEHFDEAGRAVATLILDGLRPR